MARPHLLGRRRTATTQPPRRLRVSSGAPIDVTDRKTLIGYRRRLSDNVWQEPAWIFNALIPEIGFAHDYVRDSLSRVRIVPSILSDDPDGTPQPLTDETCPKGLDLDLVDQLTQRLAPFPYYMGSCAHKIDISGEVYVALMPDPDSISGERCRVFSNRELLAYSDAWRIRQYPNDPEGIPIPPGTPFWRIWTPNPEFEILPFSHMIRLELACETLLSLMREEKAASISRIASSGKWVVMADEMSFEGASQDGQADSIDAGDGEGGSDNFFDDVQAAIEAGILDPESPGAIGPMMIRTPYSLVKDGIQVVDVSRNTGTEAAASRAEARETIATGLNLPREIILGIGATNHWNAEEIKEQAWLNHLEPRAYAILDGTTSAYLRPALLANGVDPDIVRRVTFGYDATWFLGTPDLAESADEGFAHFAISWEAWRREKGWSEADAPEQAEIDYRIELIQRQLVRTTIRDDSGVPGGAPPETVETPLPLPKEDQPGVADDAGDPQEVDIPETPDVTAPPSQTGTSPGSVPAKAKGAKKATAAAHDISLAVGRPRRHTLAGLGERQAGIEQDTLSRLVQTADATCARALERAGMRVRGKLNSNGRKQIGAQLDAARTPIAEIPATLGRTMVESFDLNEQALLTGALGDLEAKYRTAVRRAQHAVGAAAASASGQPFDADTFDQQAQPGINAGWTLLAASLMGLMTAALYDPHPEAPTVGEFDETTLVPTGLIRAALDLAGGAQETRSVNVRGADIPLPAAPTDDTTASGGATGGPTMLQAFYDQLGITDDGYTWVYGDAVRRPFEPHQDLDGTTFSSWDDDALSNGNGWPDYDYFFPSDHAGCSCLAARSYVQAGDVTTLEPGLDAIPDDQLTRTEKADATDSPRPAR